MRDTEARIDIRILPLAVLLSLTAACGGAPPIEAETAAISPPGLELDISINAKGFSMGRQIPHDFDLSEWDARTSSKTEKLDMFIGHFCGSGFSFVGETFGRRWVLTGVTTKQSYTPIFDIHADRTGTPNKNNSTLYHFKFVDEL